MRGGLVLLCLCVAVCCVSAGDAIERKRRRTTTLAMDEALALQAASVEGLQAAAAPGAETALEAATTTAAAARAVTPAPCPSGLFEWPTGTGYCWYKRDSGGAKQGPGNNVFKPANVAVNAAGQLVLTIKYSSFPGTCAEIWASQSMGYGVYVVVTETNPTMIDYRLVASPFIYANDSMEYDMEYARWNDAAAVNSQFVVQPYTTNAPVRFQVASIQVTHRIRWTPANVSFESWLPDTAGGGRINAWTYTGPNNFVPGSERFHFNHWIFTKASSLPSTSTFVVDCFRFCSQANLAACSTALGTKPRCSSTKTW